MITLDGLYNLLSGVCPTWHLESEGETFPRIVYAETGRAYESFDGVHKMAYWAVEIDLFVKEDSHEVFERLERVLAENEIPFDCDGIHYGEATFKAGKSHAGVVWYQLICEVLDV